jgi:putative DNA primase/helicase
MTDVMDTMIEETAKADFAPAFSEEALALTFVDRHAGELRHVSMWGRWMLYDGKVWKFDEKRRTFSLARTICRELAATINNSKEAKSIANAKTRAAVMSLVSDDQRVAGTVDQWDVDPWLLNTPDGTVDLRSGDIRPHRAEDHITKCTAVAPDANCPTPMWTDFLKRVTADDEQLQEYLARMCGYALTGLTTEHALFFLHGGGANGKSVFLNTVADIMGDYHCTAPIETFTITTHDRHPTELAMLRGARLVTSTETEEGRPWAESRIKQLTGGDKISARFMRQDFFEYTPQFKLGISGNHKPGLRSVDEAIKRRMNLIPFLVTIPEEERDVELRTKLKAEWPGILAWMIKGCAFWQTIGLVPPKVVVVATNAYLSEEDAFKIWMEEYCDIDRGAWTPVTQLFYSFQYWAETNKEHVGTSKKFSQKLETMGFERMKQNGKRGFLGIRLKAEPGPIRAEGEPPY